MIKKMLVLCLTGLLTFGLFTGLGSTEDVPVSNNQNNQSYPILYNHTKYSNVSVPTGKDSWPAHRAYPDVATIKFIIGQGASMLDINVTVPAGIDIDFCVHLDTNENGVFDQMDQEMIDKANDSLWTGYPVLWKEISGNFGMGIGEYEECKVLNVSPSAGKCDYFLVLNSRSQVACNVSLVDITIQYQTIPEFPVSPATIILYILLLTAVFVTIRRRFA
jgi:hypothetical protein